MNLFYLLFLSVLLLSSSLSFVVVVCGGGGVGIVNVSYGWMHFCHCASLAALNSLRFARCGHLPRAGTSLEPAPPSSGHIFLV